MESHRYTRASKCRKRDPAECSSLAKFREEKNDDIKVEFSKCNLAGVDAALSTTEFNNRDPSLVVKAMATLAEVCKQNENRIDAACDIVRLLVRHCGAANIYFMHINQAKQRMGGSDYVPPEERRSEHSPLFTALDAIAPPALIQSLLEAGAAHADAEDERDRLPLFIAMNKYKHDDRVRVMSLLLDYGARVNRKDVRYSTILHDAAYECAVDVVRLLLRRGADVHASNLHGQKALEMTLLSHAWHDGALIEGNGIKCLRLLLNAGATFATVNARSTAALLGALYTRNFKPIPYKSEILDVCSLLVDYGASLTRTTSLGVTYAHLAAQVDHVPLLRAFVAQGGNANTPVLNTRETRPLDEATFYASAHVARELLYLSEYDIDDEKLAKMKQSMEEAELSHRETICNIEATPSLHCLCAGLMMKYRISIESYDECVAKKFLLEHRK